MNTTTCEPTEAKQRTRSELPAAEVTRIVREAVRLLAPGGRYGIHELCLRPEGISNRVRREIATAMSTEIHVGVQPLCCGEWAALLDCMD
jgi:hypothetical protein